MHRRIGIWGMIVLMTIMGKQAVAQFTLTAELRPRLEFRDGYKQLASEGTDPLWIISQRTRLKTTFTHKVFGVGLCLQDVRVWGEDDIYSSTGMFGNEASIDLSEGWLELYITPSLTLKAGRQYLIYDDERILAARNWNQASITYDALLVKYDHNGKWDMDLGGIWNNNLESIAFDEPYPSGKLKMMAFGHFHSSVTKTFNASVIAIAAGFTRNDSSRIIYSRGTYGLNLNYSKNDLKARFSGYYQNGTNKKGKTVQAFFTSLVGSYGIGKFTIGAGMDYLSGQDATKSDNAYQEKDHLFELYYGARHKYFGFMDYFNNIPKSTANGGLMDLYLNTSCRVAKKHNLQLDYHYFTLAQPVAIKDENEQTIHPEKPLGSELDLIYKYSVNEFLTGELGYCAMLPTSTMELINIPGKNEKFSNWVYVMITLKPTLLKL